MKGGRPGWLAGRRVVFVQQALEFGGAEHQAILLARLLTRFLSDPALRRGVGAALRRRIETRFSPESLFDVTVRFLESCVDGDRS